MKITRIFHLKVFFFGGKILNIFEKACFRNVLHFLIILQVDSDE